MNEFACPVCGVSRQSLDADCDGCGWVRNATAPPLDQPSTACPLCNGQSYTWGNLDTPLPTSGILYEGGIRFRPADAGLINMLGFAGGERIRARKCDNCGNLQLFAMG